MTTPKPVIPIARPRGTYLAIAAAGLGFASAAVALVVTRSGPTLVSFIVLMCAAVLTLGAISILYGSMASGPILTVSDEGIMDCTTPFAVGLVRWDEIMGLATFHFYTQRYFLILLKDPKTFATRLGPLPRAVVTINRLTSPAPICIPSCILPGIDDLLAKIQQHYGDQLAAHGIRIRR